MHRILEIGNGFWNIRGSFKIAGLLDIGTQASLVRLKSGDYVLLDACVLAGEVEQQVLALTDQGRAVRAILNLHPFHTLHVKACHQRFPKAQLFGTGRHRTRSPELPWQELITEDPALHALFADDLTFSVPRGVDFVPSNQNLHFASVLACHPASGSLHVDDTLMWLDMPLATGLRFHPSLRFVLQERPGAVREFRTWAGELTTLCEGIEHLCTAHGKRPPPQPMTGAPLTDRVRAALDRVERSLARHERRYG